MRKILVEIKDAVKDGLNIIPVENILEAIPIVFGKKRITRRKTAVKKSGIK